MDHLFVLDNFIFLLEWNEIKDMILQNINLVKYLKVHKNRQLLEEFYHAKKHLLKQYTLHRGKNNILKLKQMHISNTNNGIGNILHLAECPLSFPSTSRLIDNISSIKAIMVWR